MNAFSMRILCQGIVAITTIFNASKVMSETQCDMKLDFLQKDDDARTKQTPVWSDSNTSSLLYMEKLNVNTDGTKRSYRIDDYWGTKKALNNICNATSDGCSGLLTEPELRARRMITEKAYAAGWPADLLERTKISPDIIPMKEGKPCPLVDGFLVSATALHRSKITDVCELSNYIDALTTAALVIPKDIYRKDPKTKKLIIIQSEFSKRNSRVGDLAVAMVPSSDQPVFAVIGDTGPVNLLGEGSVALNGKLLNRQGLPENYRHVRGLKPYEGKGWEVSNAVVLMFPGTRNSEDPYMTQDIINTKAKEIFDKWGGIERLKSCIKQYTH